MPLSFASGKATLRPNYSLQSAAIQNGEYFVFTYTYTDGIDLDIRVVPITPSIQGPDKSPYEAITGWNEPGNPYIYWTGDNNTLTPGGTESIYFSKSEILGDFPSSTSIALDFRAFWYGTPGLQPVTITLDVYKDGTMIDSGFVFTNPTSSIIYPNIASVQKVITSENPYDIGEKISSIQINFDTNQVLFF